MYLVECPHCGDKYHLKNVAKYAGKRVRFNCKALDCLKSYEHIVRRQPEVTSQGTVLMTDAKSQAVTMAWLAYKGVDGLVKHQLGQGEFVIGRRTTASGAQLQIAVRDINMSRQHCKVIGLSRIDGLLFTVQDLNSKNGVYLNDARLDVGEVVFLSQGDVLKLGQTQLHFITS